MSIKLGNIVKTKRHSLVGIVKGKTFLFEEDESWVKDQKKFGNIPEKASTQTVMIHILCAPNGAVCVPESDVSKDEDKDGQILAQLKEQNKWYYHFFN